MDQKEHEFFSENAKLFRGYSVYNENMAKAISKIEHELVKYDNQVISLEKRIKDKEAHLADLEVKIKERMAMAEMGAKQLMHRLDEQQRSVMERESAVAYKEQVLRETQDKANLLLQAAEATNGKVTQLRGKALQAA